MNLRNRLPFYISLIQQGLEWFGYPLICTKAKAKPLKNYKVYGNTVRSNLPEGYTQLEYIESTTSQYINTGIKGELESELTFIGQRTGDNPNQTYGHLWGDLSNSAKAISFNTPKNASSAASLRFGDKSTSSSTSPIKAIPLNTAVTIVQNKEKATASTGFEVVFDATTAFETENPLFLFTAALSGGSPTVSSHKWRCEYFSHKKNGVLVQEFIPCKNAQREIGMYDTVSGNFFKSEISTSFVAGPEVQPTPTNPIAIEYVGDKTVNMFDKETITKGAYLNPEGQRTANPNFGYGDYIKVEPGKTYTVSGKSGGVGAGYRRIHGYDSSKTWLEQILAQQVSGGTDYTLTFTAQENCEYIRFSGVSATNNYAEIKGVQIEEGSVVTSYEPYGYKIPVNVKSENMFNPTSSRNAYMQSPDIGKAVAWRTSAATTTYINCNRVEAGKTYTISCVARQLAATSARAGAIVGDDNLIKQVITTPGWVVGKNEYSFVATDDGWLYVAVDINSTDISVREFNQTTDIYLSEPLRKLGDLTDYIDYAEQKVVRQVGVEKLGTANWTYESNYTRFSRDFNSLKSVGTRMTYMLTDGFTAFTAGTGIATVPNNAVYTGASTSKAIYFKTDVYTTVSAFTDALSETYIYFPITPTEESITLPQITLPGAVTITTETTVKPSNMYGKQ